MLRSLAASALSAALLLLTPSQASAIAAPQDPLDLRTVTSTVTVDLDGRRFDARLVQPASSAGSASPSRGHRSYPVVAFGHGMLQRPSRYQSTLEAVAARGYVVIAPESEMTAVARQSVFADDLWRAIRWARAQVPQAHPSLDAVFGHSLGGGAALIAADRRPGLETVVALAPAQLTPAAMTSSRGVEEPALYVAAALDRFVPAAQVRSQFWLKPGEAMYASIKGGSHCGFNDTVILAGVCCDIATISRARQLAITHALIVGWLDEQFRDARWKLPAGIVVSTS